MTVDPPGTLGARHGLLVPEHVRAAVAPETLPVEEQPALGGLQYAALFATAAARLGRDLTALRQSMARKT